ncbi:MAG: C25 family cysteine peptidase [Chloroflexi bacterium]|nr:C25 family cysteine peptidase [Chloroflexota bacterium]
MEKRPGFEALAGLVGKARNRLKPRFRPTSSPFTGQAASIFLSLLLVLTLAACTPRPPTPGPTASAPAVKLIVDADGLYEVTAADLTAAGFDLTTGDAQALSLSADGRPIPFLLTAAGDKRTLRFYGQAAGPQAYTAQNVYWLVRGGPSPAADLPTRPAPPPADNELTGAEAVTATVRAEEQRQYQPQIGSGADRWFWASLFAPGDLKVTVAAPHAVDGEATVRVHVWGNSAAAANPDHHLTVAVNGVPAADDRWDGIGSHDISAALPAGALRAGDNQLALRAPGDTGAEADAVLLDWVEVTYRRKLVAESGGLTFEGQAAGFVVDGADPAAALWDITDPMRPVALTGYRVEQGRLRFGSDGTARRFILAAPAGLRKPAILAPAASPDPATTWGQELRAWPGGADLIVVTVPSLRDALEPLVAARREGRLRVAVVDLAAAYDTFTFGRADPAAIRDLVRWARSHWTPPAPRFLLLAGDASYDPRGYLKGAEADLVPTRLIETAHTGWTASDVWFALPDDGPAASPALAVGRFPAQTAGQMAAMVAKTLAYERGDTAAAWRHQALLVADNDDAGFTAEAQAFAGLASSYTTGVVTLEGDGSTARATLLRAFGDGVGLVGYFGHGSLILWAQEKVFSAADVARLTNRDRLPIVFTVTCLSGFFEHPTTPSLGEALLRTKDGGAVAALVPSSAALLSDQHFLAEGLARALAAAPAGGQTLGAIILQAQASLPDTPGVREILLTFNLLGDPSLHLSGSATASASSP